MKRAITAIASCVICLLLLTPASSSGQSGAAADRMRLKKMKLNKFDNFYPNPVMVHTQKRYLLLFNDDADDGETASYIRTALVKTGGKVKSNGSKFGPDMPGNSSHEYAAFWTGGLDTGEGVFFLLYTPTEDRDSIVLLMYKFNKNGKETGKPVELWEMDAPSGMEIDGSTMRITHRPGYQDFGIAISLNYDDHDLNYQSAAYFLQCGYDGAVDWTSDIKLTSKGKMYSTTVSKPVYNANWFVPYTMTKLKKAGSYHEDVLGIIRIAKIKDGGGTSGSKKILVYRDPDKRQLLHVNLLPPLIDFDGMASEDYESYMSIDSGPSIAAGSNGADLTSLLSIDDLGAHVSDPGSAVPRNISVNPSTGSGSSQTFEVSWGDDDGFEDMSSCNFMINTEVSGANCAWIQFNPNTRILSLRDDTNTDWHRAQAGSAVILENSQVRIDCSAVVFTILNLNDISIQIPMEFSNTFMGKKELFSRAQDSSDNRSAWDDMGDFTVTSSLPEPATNLYLIFGYVNLTNDNKDPYAFNFYVQEINSKGAQLRQPYELEMPDWDIDIEKVASRQYIRYEFLSDGIPSANGEARFAHTKSILEYTGKTINSESNHFMLTIVPQTGEVFVDEFASLKQRGLFTWPLVVEMENRLATLYSALDFITYETYIYFSKSRD